MGKNLTLNELKFIYPLLDAVLKKTTNYIEKCKDADDIKNLKQEELKLKVILSHMNIIIEEEDKKGKPHEKRN